MYLNVIFLGILYGFGTSFCFWDMGKPWKKHKMARCLEPHIFPSKIAILRLYPIFTQIEPHWIYKIRGQFLLKHISYNVQMLMVSFEDSGHVVTFGIFCWYFLICRFSNLDTRMASVLYCFVMQHEVVDHSNVRSNPICKPRKISRLFATFFPGS